MVEGILGSLLSKSNMINMESEGSTASSADNNAFHYCGHVFNTSRVDMTIGDWAKLSMML